MAFQGHNFIPAWIHFEIFLYLTTMVLHLLYTIVADEPPYWVTFWQVSSIKVVYKIGPIKDQNETEVVVCIQINSIIDPR